MTGASVADPNRQLGGSSPPPLSTRDRLATVLRGDGQAEIHYHCAHLCAQSCGDPFTEPCYTGVSYGATPLPTTPTLASNNNDASLPSPLGVQTTGQELLR